METRRNGRMGGGNTGVEDRQRRARVDGVRFLTVRTKQFLNVILLHRPAKNRCTPVDYYAARLCRNWCYFPPFFPFFFFFPSLFFSFFPFSSSNRDESLPSSVGSP